MAYIAADEERLADFLALTGLTTSTLRAAAATDGFARGILSYLVGDEDLLVRFAASQSADPERMARSIHAAIGPDGAIDSV